MSLLGLTEERFTRYVESLEQELENRPAFRDFRQKVLEYLERHSESISAYTPEQLISEASSFEELLALREHLKKKFGNEQAWWDYYHVKRRELATAPSYYGEGKFGVPVDPEIHHRHWGKGHQSAVIHRNLFPQKLSHAQVIGQEPLWSARGGKIPDSFSEPLPFKPKLARKYVSFDIETTGLLHQLKSPKTGSQRGLFSVGWTTETGEGSWLQRVLPPRAEKKWTGQPGRRPFFGYAVEDIIARGEQVAKEAPREVQRVAGERELLGGFVQGLRRQPRDRALIGYNIKGFDIPYMKAIAHRHGMEGELGEALKGRRIIDVAEEAKGFLSQQLSGKYLGWQRSMFEEMGMAPKGWTLEAVAQGLGYSAKRGELAHTPKTDASMAAFVHETLADTKEAKRIWATGGEQRYLRALSEQGTKLTPLSAAERMVEVRAGQAYLKPQMALPQEAYDTPLLARLSTKYGARKAPATPPVMPPSRISRLSPGAAKVAKRGIKGLKYVGGAAVLGAALPGRGPSNFIGAGASIGAWQLAASKGGGLAARAVAAGLAYVSVKGAAGAIDGMAKGGLSETIRREQTDFGSPWQGPKVSGPLSIGLMVGAGLALGAGAAVLGLSSAGEEGPSGRERVHGQHIDPDIMKFRKEWIKAPGKRKELDRLRDEAYEALQPGDLEKWRIQGYGEKIAKVDISGLKPVWEDVDTLLLEQPWYKPWRKDVGIRLTGIDAPEVEHPDEPLPWTRRKQSQPFGEESVERLKELVGDEQLELYIAGEPDQRSYKRYLGAVFREGSETPINVEAVQRGLAAALPWGESGTDIIPRELLMQEEERAAYAERGMWGEEYWQRYLDISAGAERRVTFTSFSDLPRLASNLHLAAAEELMSREDVEYEPWMGRYIGKKLETNYMGAKTKTHNKINALHYGSEDSMGAWSMRAHSDFGSGAVKGALKRTGFWLKYMWDRARGVRKRGGLVTEKGESLIVKKGEQAFAEMKRQGKFKPPPRLKKLSPAEVDDAIAHADTIFTTEAMRADTVAGVVPVGRDTVRLKNPGWKFPEVPEPATGEFDPHTKEKLARHLYRGPLPSQGKDIGSLTATRDFSLRERQEIFLRAAEKRGLKFSAMPDLSEGSAAARIREALTEFKGDFASRWDKFKHLASKLFKKGKTSADVLEAGKRHGRLGDPGAYGEAYLHSTVFEKHGIEYAVKEARVPKTSTGVSFAEKALRRNREALEEEFNALAELKGDIMPSAYYFDPSGSGKLYMELMPGKPLKAFEKTGELGEETVRSIFREVRQEVRAVASKGFENVDIHLGNIMFDLKTKKTSWIDFGMAKRITDEPKGIAEARMMDNVDYWEKRMLDAGKKKEEELMKKTLGKHQVRRNAEMSRGQAAAKLREQEAKYPGAKVPHVTAKDAARKHQWGSNKGHL